MYLLHLNLEDISLHVRQLGKSGKPTICIDARRDGDLLGAICLNMEQTKQLSVELGTLWEDMWRQTHPDTLDHIIEAVKKDQAAKHAEKKADHHE